MPDRFGDARLEELKFLAELDRGGLTESLEPGRRRDMVFSLVVQGFVTGPGFAWRDPGGRLTTGLPGESLLERQIQEWRIRALSDLLSQVSVHLEVTHLGRVRLSELKQALRADRTRERFGILWDGRHLETDLQIAILDASEDSPLSVGFLDMNGLKQINDTIGHDAGDLAVRAYFQAVATALAGEGQAFRTGGDEVTVVLPFHNIKMTTETLQKACRLVMREKLQLAGHELPRLSLSVGVVTTVDPSGQVRELVGSADKAMYRAKHEGHKHESTGRSFIAAGKDLIEVAL